MGESRAVLAIHSEPLVVARKEGGATRIQDCEGTCFNVGNPGFGQRATMELARRHWG